MSIEPAPATPFALTEDEQALHDLARDFAQRRLAPEAAAVEAAGALPNPLRKRLQGLGFCGLALPEAVGGAGLGGRALAVVLEALATGSASAATVIGRVAGPVARALLAADAVGAEALSALLQGEVVAWLGEAASGADPWLAVVDAEAARGGLALSAATGRGELAYFPAASLAAAAPTAAPLALRGAGLRPVRAVGPPAWTVALTAAEVAALRDLARLVDAAVALGNGSAALAEGARYALDRHQFGEPIAERQAVQWMLADAATELDAARLHLWDAAQGGLPLASSLALCAEAGLRAADRTLQIHGGYGYTRDYPVERRFRDAHFAALAWGLPARA